MRRPRADPAASANARTPFSSTGHLRLVKILVEANDMKKALIADKRSSSGGLSLTPSMKTGAVDLMATASVAGSGEHASTVTIPVETTFAYMLLKPSGNHGALTLLNQDPYGIG